MTTIARLKHCFLAVCALSLVLGTDACTNSSYDPGVNGQPTQGTNSAARASHGNQTVGVVPGAGPAGSQ